MNRRSILTSLIAAPAIIRTPRLLMPVKPIVPAFSAVGGIWGPIEHAIIYEVTHPSGVVERRKRNWGFGRPSDERFTIDGHGIAYARVFNQGGAELMRHYAFANTFDVLSLSFPDLVLV